MMAGWRVDKLTPTEFRVGGRGYSAMDFKVSNVGDEESPIKSIEGTVAELHKDSWYLVNIRVLDKDGSLHELKLTPLAVAEGH